MKRGILAAERALDAVVGVERERDLDALVEHEVVLVLDDLAVECARVQLGLACLLHLVLLEVGDELLVLC